MRPSLSLVSRVSAVCYIIAFVRFERRGPGDSTIVVRVRAVAHGGTGGRPMSTTVRVVVRRRVCPAGRGYNLHPVARCRRKVRVYLVYTTRSGADTRDARAQWRCRLLPVAHVGHRFARRRAGRRGAGAGWGSCNAQRQGAARREHSSTDHATGTRVARGSACGTHRPHLAESTIVST